MTDVEVIWVIRYPGMFSAAEESKIHRLREPGLTATQSRGTRTVCGSAIGRDPSAPTAGDRQRQGECKRCFR